MMMRRFLSCRRLAVALLACWGAAACSDRLAAEARAADAQGGHDVVIARVMANPSAAPDNLGEWIEIANRGRQPVELRGWRLDSGHDGGFVVPASLVVAPRASVILARSADEARNGGVHAAMAFTGITLGNARDWVALRDPSGTTVDSVAWERAVAGRAIEHQAGTAAAAPPRPATPAPAPVRAPVNPPGIASDARPATPRELVVRVLDIGQGDAILIQNGGSTVLVDGGPNPAALGAHLDALGLNGSTIDAVILTHEHADHYQGLRELFASRRHITVRYFWENQDPSPNVTLARLRDSIASRVAAGSLVYRDTDDPCATDHPLCTVTLKGGAKLHIMRPDPLGQGPNNRSPALKLVGPDSASFTMWMAGDAEQEAIDFFDRTAEYWKSPGMRVDVLKADHHGSCNGVSDRYLDLLRPTLLVVSLGAANDYGHMHEQAKAAYQRHGVPWYRTDQNGTIVMRSPGMKGGGYAVSVERGEKNASGPSDRRSTQAGCAGM
jgi:competence protein ComEC